MYHTTTLRRISRDRQRKNLESSFRELLNQTQVVKHTLLGKVVREAKETESREKGEMIGSQVGTATWESVQDRKARGTKEAQTRSLKVAREEKRDWSGYDFAQ